MSKSENIILVGGYFRFDVDTLRQIKDWAVDERMPFTVLDAIGQQMALLSTSALEWHSVLPRLLRANCFGKSGDLTLRRDEDNIHWHYIGYAPSTTLPLNAEKYEGQLEIDDTTPMQALLWGDYNPNRGRWYEPRVGKANLDYPLDLGQKEGHRVMSYAHVVRDIAHDDEIVAYWTYALQLKEDQA